MKIPLKCKRHRHAPLLGLKLLTKTRFLLIIGKTKNNNKATYITHYSKTITIHAYKSLLKKKYISLLIVKTVKI